MLLFSFRSKIKLVNFIDLGSTLFYLCRLLIFFDFQCLTGSKATLEVAPDTKQGNTEMKRVLMLLFAAFALTAGCFAQKNANARTFEQSQTRFSEPEVRVFIKPMVADMQMKSTTRQAFGPYSFAVVRSLNELTQYQIEECKKTALYRTNAEAGSDIMVAALFNVYIDENDKQTLKVDVTGFPAVYTNFHLVNIDDQKELKMIETIYGNPNWISGQLKDRVNQTAVK